jgi:hypothetical protein
MRSIFFLFFGVSSAKELREEYELREVALLQSEGVLEGVISMGLESGVTLKMRN